MNNEKYLPIGTVVKLKDINKKLMITGFCSYDLANKEKAYDYTGCLYPEGIISSKQMALFNHEEIEKIFYMGYADEEEKKFKDLLVKSINQNNNEN